MGSGGKDDLVVLFCHGKGHRFFVLLRIDDGDGAFSSNSELRLAGKSGNVAILQFDLVVDLYHMYLIVP